MVARPVSSSPGRGKLFTANVMSSLIKANTSALGARGAAASSIVGTVVNNGTSPKHSTNI